MYPPVFSLAYASSSVRALLGTPLRLWLFGEQPQRTDSAYATPYAVWTTVNVAPENYLAGVPDADFMLVQVDVYGASPDQVREAAQALRDVYEVNGYVMAARDFPREADTRLYRYQMDVSIHVTR